MGRLVFFLVFITALASCASTFPFKYYVIHPSSDLLLGQEPKDDLSLSKTCEPDEVVKGKCIALKVEEFQRLIDDYKRLQNELKECQRNCQ